MDNLALSLILGISSSLVATALFIFISELIRKFFIPWYENKIYRGVRIDGIWEGPASMTLVLEQHGDSIKGTYSHQSSDTQEIETYTVDGKIKDSYFTAIAWPTSNRHMDCAAFLLHIYNEKSNLIMKGGVLGQSSTPGIIATSPDLQFTWKKN